MTCELAGAMVTRLISCTTTTTPPTSDMMYCTHCTLYRKYPVICEVAGAMVARLIGWPLPHQRTV